MLSLPPPPRYPDLSAREEISLWLSLKEAQVRVSARPEVFTHPPRLNGGRIMRPLKSLGTILR